MLFAWGDDANIQERIIPLDTMDAICHFLNTREDFIFIIDQLNALEQGPDNCNSNHHRSTEISQWLTLCRADRKAVLSTSANYQAYIQRSVKENTEDTLYVYGGLTPVSLNGKKKKKRLYSEIFLIMI
jgi:hypothetical protein